MWLSRSDLRYTLRQISRKPGFVLLAALVLAAGLAVSLIAFTICYTAFYRPLPITNGERIVHVCPFPHGRECGPLRADDFSRIRSEITSLGNLGVYTERAASVEYDGDAWRMAAVATEWNLFRLSQTEALIGRTLQAVDHAPDAEAVAVIGYDLWQRRFAGDSEVVGTVVGIDRQPVRIVGVMPEGYAMPWSAQLWLPISPTVLAPLDSNAPMPLVETYALLEPGISMEQASQEITQLMARNRAQFPADPFAEYPRPYLRIINGMTTGHVGSFQTAMVDDIGLVITIGIMNTLTLLVFLLACINVGTLLLARINERMKDTSIRVALGAPRMRVLTQMCLESTFVTLLGAALALLLAGMGLEVLMLAARTLNDSLLPFWMDFHVDASTLAAVVLYVLLAIGLTAVLPGWRVVNGNFNATMRDGTRGALGLRPGRFSRGLVVAALMIVTLLLYLVTLLGSTVIPVTNMLTRIPDNLISGGIMLDAQRYSEDERQQFVRTLTSRMANEPSIAFGNVVVNLGDVRVEAEDGVAGDRVRAALSSQNVPRAGEVDPDFASGVDDSLVVRLLEGRMFTDADNASSEPVVTISRNLAERLWPGQSAVDERLRIVGVQGIAEDWRRVVGVASDSAAASFTTEIRPISLTLVLPLPQIDTSERLFAVTAFASSDAAKSRAMQFLRDEFSAAATSVEPFVQDPETLVSSVTGAFRVGMRLALLIGLFVLMVAMAGIYGLTQNVVQMATHEIGVRRALGARDGLITKTFMKRTGRQVLTGFLAAMLFCAPVTLLFYMLSQEFGLDVPFSLGMSAIVIVLLYAAVMLATYLPVRRILRLEPGDALRYE